MIIETGHFALILALVLGFALTVLPCYGYLRSNLTCIALARPMVKIQFSLVLISYLALTYGFLTNDFSVDYIARHANSHLPLIYKISGVWGGHEGSLLLWVLILTVWMVAVAVFSRAVPENIIALVLCVLGMISVGFLLFTLFTSNPFIRLLPVPPEGGDLNPLLQDIGLAIHPPMLYFGYVGFAVPFAFAIAALIAGRFDAAWARWVRPWSNIAWMFLTIGITLGSWWAYYELGWGGWWFWDPVENASFMPWLVGTALIHSLAATEKRGIFKAWTILLAIAAFSLSLLGTFLVRSGVLISVHAFATDPARGVFILIFLGIVTGGALLLYAWRAHTIRGGAPFGFLSRECGLLVNNILLCTLCFAVLLGTLYPLILDALNLGRISVGPPYFDLIFAVIGLPVALFAGVFALLRWKRDTWSRSHRSLLLSGLIALLAAPAALLLMPDYRITAIPGVFTGIFICMLCIAVIRKHLTPANRPVRFSLTRVYKVSGTIIGMSCAHLGVGIFIIGVTLSNVYSVESDVRLAPGDSHHIHGFEFSFAGLEPLQGANYSGIQGQFEVWKDNQLIARLFPQKRVYLVQKEPMTEAAIDAGLSRDLYVALGEQLDEQAWAVRIYYKPFIRCIWLGALLMAMGGLIAAADKRYRRTKPLPVRSLSALIDESKAAV